MPDVIVDYDMSRETFSIVQQEEVRELSDDHGRCLPTCKQDTPEYLDAQTREDKNYHNVELRGWKDFSDSYCCERKEAISHDGVKVPLTILYSRKAWQRGLSPGILQGYGAYGEVLDKTWCPDRLSLLDRGWVMAFADVRFVTSNLIYFLVEHCNIALLEMYINNSLCIILCFAFRFGVSP